MEIILESIYIYFICIKNLKNASVSDNFQSHIGK